MQERWNGTTSSWSEMEKCFFFSLFKYSEMFLQLKENNCSLDCINWATQQLMLHWDQILAYLTLASKQNNILWSFFFF